MRDVITAAGMLSLLGVPAWYVGSVLLRVAALGWFVFAGVGLLLAGHGDQSPWPFAGLGVGCWAAGHVLDRAPADGWPPRSLRASSPDAGSSAGTRPGSSAPAAATRRQSPLITAERSRLVSIGRRRPISRQPARELPVASDRTGDSWSPPGCRLSSVPTATGHRGSRRNVFKDGNVLQPASRTPATPTPPRPASAHDGEDEGGGGEGANCRAARPTPSMTIQAIIDRRRAIAATHPAALLPAHELERCAPQDPERRGPWARVDQRRAHLPRSPAPRTPVRWSASSAASCPTISRTCAVTAPGSPAPVVPDR